MLYALITIITFFIMEGVSWASHKYLMHGNMWFLHEDHHQHKPGFFEKNDAFFLIFAVPSASSFVFGSIYPEVRFLVYIGLGILLYGIAYFFVHDVFIHQRFKWFTRTNNRYLRAIRKAHKIHHKHLNKEDGECFGMLLVPYKYWKEAKR